MKDGLVLAKIISHKLGYPLGLAECVARDMIRDDFPKNGVKTMGEAIAYLDEVRARADKAGGAST